MREKKQNGFRYICRILFAITVFGLVLAIIFNQPLVRYLKLSERNASWKGQIRSNWQAIKVALNEKDYIYSTMLLRCTKMRAEFLNKLRSEYISELSSVKNELPPTIEILRLPYDLREINEAKVLYGLCSSGRLRLSGTQRTNELGHLADEIKLIQSSDRNSMLFGYGNIIEKMYQLERIDDEDIRFLEMRSGCDILDSSGYSVFTF